MAWDCDVSAEIADLFARLSGHVDWKRFRVVDALAFVELRDRERNDAAFRARCSERRERKRRARIAADPLYAARVKAIAKAAYQRRKQRMLVDPALRERERKRWRESKQRGRAEQL